MRPKHIPSPHDVSLRENISYHASKLRRRLVEQGASTESAQRAADKYAASRRAMEDLVGEALAASDALARVPTRHRRYVRAMASGWFRLTRRLSVEQWPDALASLAARNIREGMDAESVRAALGAVWRYLAPPLAPSEFERMMALAGAKSEPAGDDELAALSRPSPLQSFGERLAREKLCAALATQDPVVRRCVALRLLRELRCEKLASELDLSLDDVKLILEKMRPWVHRFTTYYDATGFWVDGARKFRLVLTS